MEQLIRTGHTDYCNPYGEDDQETFLGRFYEVTQREEKAFLKTAKKNKFRFMANVTKMFDNTLTRPLFYVTLKGETDARRERAISVHIHGGYRKCRYQG
jgi:hypothetical protein